MNPLTISSLTCALLAASCLAAPSSLPASGSNALTQAINSFSLDLFDQIARSKEQENVFLSPYSVSTVLSMLLAGAKGSTADQLIKSLHLDSIDAEGKEKGLQLISDAIHSKSNDSTLSLANYLLIQKEAQDADNTVLANYKSSMESGFDAKVDDVDFATQGPQVMRTVNDWVKEQTHGLISKILDEPPSSDTVLMLLNAIYFKGSWASKFDDKDTSKRTFYNKAENGIQTDFMQQTLQAKLRSEDVSGHGVRILDLPYENETYAMTILLPEERDGLKKILAAPDSKEQLGKALTPPQYQFKSKVNVKLPKFKLETKYDLIPALRALGISEIFGGGDLSGIRGSNNLAVSQIKHKAVVKVDEEGTEAAAVTYGMVFAMSASVLRRPQEFVADHPFLFVIRDQESGMILFVGKVEDL